MVDSKENYKFNLGVKGLKKKRGFNKLNQQRQTTKWNKHKNKEI